MLHETRKSGRFLLVGGIILAAWCIAQITNAAEPFMLTSLAFKDGTPMPKKHANNTPGNANCVGENVSLHAGDKYVGRRGDRRLASDALGRGEQFL